MKCPFCGSELDAYTAPSRLANAAASPVLSEGVVLDHCDACKGVWFDRGELSLVAGVNLSNLRFVGSDNRVRPKCRGCGADNARGATVCEYCKETLHVQCPRCEEGRLFRTTVLNTPVDTCFTCGGIWIGDNAYEILRSSLLASIAQGGIICSSCGKKGLTTKDSMMSEHGPVCDACGLASQRSEMEQFATQEPDGLAGRPRYTNDYYPGSYPTLFQQILAALLR